MNWDLVGLKSLSTHMPHGNLRSHSLSHFSHIVLGSWKLGSTLNPLPGCQIRWTQYVLCILTEAALSSFLLLCKNNIPPISVWSYFLFPLDLQQHRWATPSYLSSSQSVGLGSQSQWSLLQCAVIIIPHSQILKFCSAFFVSVATQSIISKTSTK